jgi:hypothetical protein
VQTANKDNELSAKSGDFSSPSPVRDTDPFSVGFSGEATVPGRDDGKYPVEKILTNFAGRKFMSGESRQGK